jgi:hypothetical protein
MVLGFLSSMEPLLSGYQFSQSTRPVAMAAFTSPIAWVISISRGQHSVQLKTVWQRYTPN